MIYASRLEGYKKPFGAVKAGEKVAFTLTPPRSAGWWRAFLCVKYEFGDMYSEHNMDWNGLHGDSDVYHTELDTTGLLGPVWYWFRCERTDGVEGFYDNPGIADGECAYVTENPRAFQLTVTLPDYTPVPEWFGRGLTYHIFPDRFCKGKAKTPDLQSMPGERILHEDWYDCPIFRPDEKGEVRNRDFFGGNIAGVREKLPYIQSLGAKTIYFSPIFEAASNHRYDTACYSRVDPLFGTEKEFAALCDEAAALGIRIILDGVFNHTGYNSVYFNGAGFYQTLGAYQSEDSPYYKWYNFQKWPDEYESWWGIYTLPQVNESHPDYIDYIVKNKDSVVRRWLRAGASGWRLDVADELPDEFIKELRNAARGEKEDAVIIGEVWEDASNKIAYSVRRRYLLGRELDSVMNYPMRDSLIGYVMGGDAAQFKNAMEALRENYPRDIYHSLMNALGTHDTPRILTVLGATPGEWAQTKEGRSETILPPERRELAVKRLKLASAVLFTFPGSPTVFYGDEAGLEGFEDPFNRRGYPWGREDKDLLKWYTLLGKARNGSEALQTGDIHYIRAEGGLLVYERVTRDLKNRALICVNRGDTHVDVTAGGYKRTVTDVFSKEKICPADGVLTVPVEPMSVRVLI
ncbi:MAG: glycoside hydrolase family 13 protein [Oscillospiraceae bacterium]|jgi:glycosidase|nr:glycoside hydrolase family 13 protein [Oscillospiraceae bacterium]